MISKHPFQLVWRSLSVVALVLALSACINVTVVKRTTGELEKAIQRSGLRGTARD